MKERWKTIWSNSEDIAITYLEKKGYILNRISFVWTHRNEEHIPTPKELDAVDYLKEEWAYKGIE